MNKLLKIFGVSCIGGGIISFLSSLAYMCYLALFFKNGIGFALLIASFGFLAVGVTLMIFKD